MIRKCYRTRIGRAMMMVFLALIVPLVVLGVFMATTSASTIRSEIVQNYNNLLHMSSNQFTERLMDARQLAISLTVDDDLNSFCISSDSRRDLFRYWLFQDRLRSYASQRMMENRISVWLPRQGWVISTHDSIYRVGESERPALTSADALERAVWGVHPSVADPEKTCLSLSVGYVHEQQSNAIFFIEITPGEICEALAPLDDSDGIAGVFLAGRDGALYMEDSSGLDQRALAEKLALSPEADGFSHTQTGYRQDERRYTVLTESLPGTECAIGILLDDGVISRPNRSILDWSLAEIFVFVAVAVAYMYIVYRQIVRPIDGVRQAMQRVGRGDFSGCAVSDSRNEIGDIEAALNQMTARLQTLIQQKYVDEMNLAQTQLKFLRAQINPHFLYNCLFTLYTFIKNEDLDNAADLAVYLGQYYQINTRADSGDVALYQELEHVRLLVKIQSMRFSGRLRYDEEIDEPLRMLRIPSLTLLTVAENFLTHGIKNLRGTAELRITARREDGWILLRVADTGTGVEPEQLEQMRSALDAAQADGANIRGLQNVLLRFRMLFGPETAITVAANEPQGQIVEIYIPDKGETENV